MTVRSWFTISTVVVVALFVAVALKLVAPASPPAIVARDTDTHLPGSLQSACWPQNSGHNRCTHGGKPPKDSAILPRNDKIRVVVAYPIQPKDGTIRIVRSGRTVLRTKWSRYVSYELESGRYSLIADAKYPRGV